jgi:beta-galactosidase
LKPWQSALWFGGDYNPEQWPKGIWQEDLQLMVEAGVTTVSLGIFSWANLEPSEGTYTFDWLDEVIAGLHSRNISIDLANATASPPAWLGIKYPDTKFTDQFGVVRSHGGRQNFCPSSQNYRRAAQALTEQLAQRYGKHPAIAMWHVHNEYACHNARDYSETSAIAFRGWLRTKYQNSLSDLNRAWGTDFWSQRYHSWDEISTPKITPDGTSPNPTMQLDFARFSSDALLECFIAERDIIHRHSPGVPVTTNFMTIRGFNKLDYWKWAKEVDVISTDHYLMSADPYAHVELALQADTTRGLANGAPWLLMEHSTSAVNWQPRNRSKDPKEMLRNSIQHIAHGADGAMFFQWRASFAGSEKFHSGLVPHVGKDSKVWREVVQLGANLQSLAEITGSTIENKVALIWDYESWWALDQPNLPSIDLNYINNALGIYSALWDLNIGVDVIPVNANQSELGKYRLVIAPMTYLMSKDSAKQIGDYVSAGGSLLATFFTGISDLNDHIYLGGYPGPLRQILGISIEEFAPLLEGKTTLLSNGYEAEIWAERATATSAEVLATYKDPALENSVAISRNSHGEGSTWYLGTSLNRRDMSDFVTKLIKQLDLPSTLVAPPGVEAVRRAKDGQSWLFVINHTNSDVKFQASGHELITDEKVFGNFKLAAGQIAVFREQA